MRRLFYEVKRQGKKLCSVFLAVAMFLTSGSTGFAASETQYMEGYLKDDPTEIAELDMSGQTVSDFVGNLPSSVDLSNTAYFPAIGNQKNLGACGPFATAYYQFTYEVNRLNGTSAGDAARIASPKYIYNFINGGAKR